MSNGKQVEKLKGYTTLKHNSFLLVTNEEYQRQFEDIGDSPEEIYGFTPECGWDTIDKIGEQMFKEANKILKKTK